MSLQLAFQHYDSLDQLGKALDSLHDCAFEQLMAITNNPNGYGPYHGRPVEMSREEFKALCETVVLGVSKANLMLGKILLAINEDNSHITSKPRAEWEHTTSTLVPTVSTIAGPALHSCVKGAGSYEL